MVALPAEHFVLNIPSQAIAGGQFPVLVVAADAEGLIDPLFEGTITLGLTSGPTNGKLLGALTVTAQNGVASFSNISLSMTGNYVVFAGSTTDVLGAAVPVEVAPTTRFKITPTATSITSEKSAIPLPICLSATRF